MAPFKVAIVGGGMTGLTAALHLDRLGIDFILLEAYSEITPEVGASLALYPNFQRVLDQLGVLEEAHRESSELCTLTARDGEGKIMFAHHVADAIHASTGGYGIGTFTRSQLLRILHRNISEDGKKKIHTSQRVSRIEQLPGDEGVRLHIEGGQTHEVDVVIGADGTHSVVRSEMWRLAEEAGSKAFAGDKGEDAETEFGCVFGLSTNTGDLKKDHAYQVSSRDLTIGLFGGAQGEALWFIFFKAVKDKAGKKGLDFPKWSLEEGTKVCEKFSSAKLTDKTTFGDVFANRYRLTTQACPNHSLRRWHYGRLICLGDSVAKTNPILAQGGAQGAESVLMLVDRIQEALQQKKPDNKKLSTPQVEGIFKEVNAKREPRVRDSVAKSQQLIRLLSWSNWFLHFIGKYIAPLLPTWVVVSQALAPWKGSYQSTTLPLPSHPNRSSGVSGGASDDKDKSKPVVDVKAVPESASET